jgi:hypothetical protein
VGRERCLTRRNSSDKLGIVEIGNGLVFEDTLRLLGGEGAIAVVWYHEAWIRGLKRKAKRWC